MKHSVATIVNCIAFHLCKYVNVMQFVFTLGATTSSQELLKCIREGFQVDCSTWFGSCNRQIHLTIPEEVWEIRAIEHLLNNQ